jgi:hypothetical protein
MLAAAGLTSSLWSPGTALAGAGKVSYRLFAFKSNAVVMYGSFRVYKQSVGHLTLYPNVACGDFPMAPNPIFPYVSIRKMVLNGRKKFSGSFSGTGTDSAPAVTITIKGRVSGRHAAGRLTWATPPLNPGGCDLVGPVTFGWTANSKSPSR